MRRADVAEARAKAAESKLGSIAKLAQGGAPVDVCPKIGRASCRERV